MEELLGRTRDLGGRDERRPARLCSLDQSQARTPDAMAKSGHGFPRLAYRKCSAASEKHWVNNSDIHGGGMDLATTHHTNEIARPRPTTSLVSQYLDTYTNMLT